MFAVTSYTVHSKTKICYSIHTTRHITLKCSLSDRKCIIIYIYIYMYLKCVCIVMISTDGSMHNKRFIILNGLLLLHVAIHVDSYHYDNVFVSKKQHSVFFQSRFIALLDLLDLVNISLKSPSPLLSTFKSNFQISCITF